MFKILAAVAIHFILVHAPDKQVIHLAIDEISSIRQPRDTEGAHFQKDIQCVVVMNNGKFIGTVETCLEIIKKIAEFTGDKPPEEQPK
jgi:hypothetical protein